MAKSRQTRKTRKTSRTATRRAATPKPADVVGTWEDDPGDPQVQPAPSPITVAAPHLGAQPLPSRIDGPAPPVKVFPQGTAEFRFYAAATALRRTSDFWGAIIGTPITWQIGKILPVILDDGVDLNAFYTRGDFGGEKPGLHFFHQTVSGRTYFSGESPDIVSHEMGHAVLDALRPQLFDANTIEAAAFHESFGDMSAILSALQVESFRQAVLSETDGILNRASRLSRLAEQLGAAIRIQHPDSVDPDCLRNAANSFFYRDPQTLPPVGPASTLTSEPHSFSRVFTAAFLDILAGVFRSTGTAAASSDLLASTQDVGRLLVASIKSAPVVPDYYSQVAVHMIEAGEQAPLNGRYRDIMKGAFIRRGIISLEGATTIVAGRKPAGRRPSARALAAEAPMPAPSAELPLASIPAARYGLTDAVLKVYTPEEPKRFAVTSSSLMLGALEPRSPQNAAESFTEDLFQRGRVDIGEHGSATAGGVHPYTTKTHFIDRRRGDLVLRRRTFDCGLG